MVVFVVHVLQDGHHQRPLLISGASSIAATSNSTAKTWRCRELWRRAALLAVDSVAGFARAVALLDCFTLSSFEDDAEEDDGNGGEGEDGIARRRMSNCSTDRLAGRQVQWGISVVHALALRPTTEKKKKRNKTPAHQPTQTLSIALLAIQNWPSLRMIPSDCLAVPKSTQCLAVAIDGCSPSAIVVADDCSPSVIVMADGFSIGVTAVADDCFSGVTAIADEN
ncbi:hypothetical protein IWX90DRAFT_156019 [Phyllosticta citrichinensis]|uniref:Uncharacterized protein n=1 Tax=Phyllosticta citrichinensis TaxID=1130410 RepID=A0ABR1Y0E0_9PEZI